MVGVVVVTHLRVAEELKKATELIAGPQQQLQAVCLFPEQNSDEMCREIELAIKKVNDSSGILILTDMFGGSPSNLSLSFLKKDQVEVITGVNLPMLIKLVSLRNDNSLTQLTKELVKYTRENILAPSEILGAKS